LQVLHGSQCREQWYKLLALAPLSSLGVAASEPDAVALAAAQRLRDWLNVLFEEGPGLAQHLEQIWPKGIGVRA
jgi:hypothetical protein